MGLERVTSLMDEKGKIGDDGENKGIYIVNIARRGLGRVAVLPVRLRYRSMALSNSARSELKDGSRPDY